MKTTLGLASIALALSLTAPNASAQVVLSEVSFVNNAQWIELRNMGTADVDLSSWSVHHATTSKPGNHWFGFPKNTFIKGNGYLRVHWLASVQASTATDVYTGDTVYHFLFGLFATTLDESRGALALYNSQSSAKMNTTTAMVDWVSWGTTGFQHESVAIAGKHWIANSFAPAATGNPLPTLAYDYRSPGSAGFGSQWYLDTTPTPGAHNVGDASVSSFGKACASAFIPPVHLEVSGMPASGNKNFAIRTDRDLSANEIGLQLLSIKQDLNATYSVMGCSIYVDLFSIFFTSPVIPVGGKASVNYGQFGLTGVYFNTQWAIIDTKTLAISMTDGLRVQFEK